MIKASFSTLACPDWNLSEVISAAARFGYDGVELRGISRELDLWKLPEFRPPGLSGTRDRFESQGLVVPVVGSSASFHSADHHERQRNLDSALRMAEVAAGLGALAIRVFGDRIQPGQTRRQTAGWIADSLAHLAERMVPGGVQIWLESHGDFVTSQDLLEIFARFQTSAIGIVWDPANAFDARGELPRILPQLSSRVRHVHLKDLVRDSSTGNRYVLTGEGHIPFDGIFADLASFHFDGFVSFEWEKLWHPDLLEPEVALPHFLEWWKNRGERND